MKNKYNAFNQNTDKDQCKKDLLYLVDTVDNWKEKPFLYTALISHLTGSPFYYDKETAISVYDELTENRLNLQVVR